MNYDEKLKNILEGIGSAKKMVLATSVNDIVSARTISVLVFDNKFYFQTDMTMDKAKDILHNKNIALAVGNIQVRGICKDIGHPMESQNEKFLTYFKEHYNSAYTKYSHLENERVYEITPTFIKLWRYVDDSPHIEIIDCGNRVCSSVKYEI